uniref:Uncharacterized protein n=1 Tax=Triticum urartu TaxID=4572 RepID=A0A8R7PSX2_TRIUA
MTSSNFFPDADALPIGIFNVPLKYYYLPCLYILSEVHCKVC